MSDESILWVVEYRAPGKPWITSQGCVFHNQKSADKHFYKMIAEKNDWQHRVVRYVRIERENP